jgi:hypothetical protein
MGTDQGDALDLIAASALQMLWAPEGVKKSGYSQLRLATRVDSRNVLAVRLWQSPIFSHRG